MSEKVNSQGRILREVEILCANCAFGLTNKELAGVVGTSEANVCRDLSLLENRGWIIRSEKDGRIRLSPKFGNFANEMMKGFKTAKLQLAEDEARYASEMQ
jgi:DNA-binding IclR family transcriptional regulator